MGQKTQVDLFNHLTATDQHNLCINQIVLSEFMYHWLAVGSRKAPVTLKRDGSIPDIMRLYNPADLLVKLIWIDVSEAVVPLCLHFMERYNLLPNDAIILATCKLNGITQLASYDADFATACRDEGIRLIRDITDLN